MRIWLSFTLVALSGLVALACGERDLRWRTARWHRWQRWGRPDLRAPSSTRRPVVTTCVPWAVTPSASSARTASTASASHSARQPKGATTTTPATSRGRCVPDVATGGTGGTGNTGGNACQSVTITPTRSIPNVMFLVDQSGSMDASFGSMRREPLGGGQHGHQRHRRFDRVDRPLRADDLHLGRRPRQSTVPAASDPNRLCAG